MFARWLTIVFKKLHSSEKSLNVNWGGLREIIKLLVGLLLFGMPPYHGYAAGQENGAIVAKMPAIPKGKETDVRYYAAAGGTLVGREAFEQMPKAGLVLWLAGNQFFAMDDVVHTFQKQHPGITVGTHYTPSGPASAGDQGGQVGLR